MNESTKTVTHEVPTKEDLMRLHEEWLDAEDAFLIACTLEANRLHIVPAAFRYMSGLHTEAIKVASDRSRAAGVACRAAIEARRRAR